MFIYFLKIIGGMSMLSGILGGICQIILYSKYDSNILERMGVGFPLVIVCFLLGVILLSCAYILENQYNTYIKLSTAKKLEKWCCEECGKINKKMCLRCSRCGRIR